MQIFTKPLAWNFHTLCDHFHTPCEIFNIQKEFMSSMDAEQFHTIHL